MRRYIYEGPVYEFDKLISEKWRGETVAKSEKQAKVNLAYQYKKKTGRKPTSKISLPGKISIRDYYYI